MRRMRICAAALLGVLAIAGVAAAASTNRVAVVVPPYVMHGNKNTYSVTINGYSRKPAIAYLFLDYRGCARSFAAEHQRAQSASRYYGVRGRFTKPSEWASSSPGIDYACGYLMGRTSGTLLAKAHVKFTVH